MHGDKVGEFSTETKNLEVDSMHGTKLEELSSEPLQINLMEQATEATWTLAKPALDGAPSYF